MSQPLVSIIVTSYCTESAKYLDLCIKSIRNLSYDNLEVIIVGRPDYLPVYAGCKTISPPEESFLNGRGINYGVENSRGEYLLILNDDTVLTKDCILPLLEHAKFANVMPISNDQQGRYSFPMKAPSSFEEVSDNLDAWINSNSPYPPGVLVSDTLCLYAHMISRDVWNRVGPMDDNAGLIDIDWCLRARQAGYLNIITLSAYVIHFGGSSVSITLDGPKRLKQKEQFKAKWGWNP